MGQAGQAEWDKLKTGFLPMGFFPWGSFLPIQLGVVCKASTPKLIITGLWMLANVCNRLAQWCSTHCNNLHDLPLVPPPVLTCCSVIWLSVRWAFIGSAWSGVEQLPPFPQLSDGVSALLYTPSPAASNLVKFQDPGRQSAAASGKLTFLLIASMMLYQNCLYMKLG